MIRREIIHINPEFGNIRPLVEQITSHGIIPGAEIIYCGSRNTLFKTAFPDSNSEIVVKAFKIPALPNNFIYCGIREGKARRSYNHAIKLLQLGFHTPMPLGYSEVRLQLPTPIGNTLLPRLCNSYYFSEYTPDPNIREFEIWPDYPKIARILGEEIARLHTAGVYHRDFSMGNILIHRNESGNTEYFSYVDLNRMEFGVKDKNRLYEMFRALVWNEQKLRLITDAYATAMNEDPDKVWELAVPKMRHYLKRFFRKEHTKQLKKKIRETILPR